MRAILLFLSFFLLSCATALAQVQANNPDPILICEVNPSGFAVFDLTVREGQITSTPSDFEYTYYMIQNDAINKHNPIAEPENYHNLSNPETIYVRVEDLITGDFAVVELELIIDEFPTINTNISILYAYELVSPDIGIFDLTEKIPEIIGSQTDLDVTFYESPIDAENEIDSILDPTAYENPHNPCSIWARVENSSGCFSIASFILIPKVVLSVPDFSATNIIIYPNPSKGFINIEYGLNLDFQVAVYSMKGELVLAKMQELDTGNIKLDLTNLNSGIYLLTLTSNKTTIVKRIVKK